MATIINGAAIRKKRKKLGFTIAELSEQTGISIDTISTYERNLVEHASLLTVRRLEQALGVRKGTFFL